MNTMGIVDPKIKLLNADLPISNKSTVFCGHPCGAQSPIEACFFLYGTEKQTLMFARTSASAVRGNQHTTISLIAWTKGAQTTFV